MSSTTLKTPCVVCDKGSGLFKCEGCGQNFCTKHVTEHRQTLQHQLDKVVVEHDSIQQTIKENKIQNSPLIKYIDEWEETSIIKITQMSAEFRQIVSQLNDTHIKTVSSQLNLLTQQIKTARENDDFYEIDIDHWISTLNELKQKLVDSSLPNNILEDESSPLIYQLKVITSTSQLDDDNVLNSVPLKHRMNSQEDFFERCMNGAIIADNGRLAIHNGNDCSVEVRGTMGYLTGVHRFRFQIERNPLSTWIFIGIISKSTPMSKDSYESLSAYGWADYDDYVVAGTRPNENTGRFLHTHEKDIIELVLDCTNRRILYKNKRTQREQHLDIDLKQCPFPWQLHVNFFGKDDQIRLLTVSHNTSLCQ